eukprot:gene24403-biopygen1370
MPQFFRYAAVVLVHIPGNLLLLQDIPVPRRGRRCAQGLFCDIGGLRGRRTMRRVQQQTLFSMFSKAALRRQPWPPPPPPPRDDGAAPRPAARVTWMWVAKGVLKAGCGALTVDQGPRRSSDRYPGGPGRCQKGSAVAVTDIQGPLGDGPLGDVRRARRSSDRYPGGPRRCQVVRRGVTDVRGVPDDVR